MSSCAISLVLIPSDVALLTEEGTKALFSATLSRTQVKSASFTADQEQQQQQIRPDDMLINKLLFCACSVACELATTSASSSGHMLTPTSRDQSLSRRVSKDTVLRSADGSWILFSFPVESGNYLLALQVPEDVVTSFGASLLLNLFVQTLVGGDVTNLLRSSGLRGGGGDAEEKGSLSLSSTPFADALKSEVALVQLQRRVLAVIQALLLLVFPSAQNSASPLMTEVVDTSTVEVAKNPAGKVLSQVRRMSSQTGVLAQNSGLALSNIHPVLSDALAGLVPGESPLCYSLRQQQQKAGVADCRFVERGVAVWERGRLLYYTGTSESFREHLLPCAVLALLSTSKNRSMPLYRVAAARFPQQSSNFSARSQWEGGYFVPPTEEDSLTTKTSAGGSNNPLHHHFCMVGIFGDLIVTVLLKPSLTPYNGAPLEAIHGGLVSFLTASQLKDNNASSQWPYLLQDLVEDLMLPPAHPLALCHNQLKLVFAMRSVFISRRLLTDAKPVLCVASPCISSASPAAKRWTLETAARSSSAGPVFSCVRRPRTNVTEGFGSLVLVGARTMQKRDKSTIEGPLDATETKKTRKRLCSVLHIAVEAGRDTSPAQMRALIHYIASKSW